MTDTTPYEPVPLPAWASPELTAYHAAYTAYQVEDAQAALNGGAGYTTRAELLEQWGVTSKALAAACPNAEMVNFNQAEKEWWCRITNRTRPEIHTSPCGKWVLVTSHCETPPGYFGHTVGEVYPSIAGTTLDTLIAVQPVATVYRNYGSFWHTWVCDHPDGHSYMVCGSDYQGQTVVQLGTGAVVDYIPNSAGRGHGFCWTGVEASPNKLLLAASGCYWGGPYTVRIHDFRSPMAVPWGTLLDDRSTEKLSWHPDSTATLERGYDRVKPLGTPWDGKQSTEMTMEEEDALDAWDHGQPDLDSLWEWHEDEVPWQCPSAPDVCRKYAEMNIAWHRGYSTSENPLQRANAAVPLDTVVMAGVLEELCDASELAQLAADEPYQGLLRYMRDNMAT